MDQNFFTMKSSKALASFVIVIIMIANIGCKKDPPPTQVNVGQAPPPPPPPSPPPPPTRVNTPPHSFAGQDQLIFFPTNFCILNGNAYDAENNIRTILWSKISGPSSVVIENQDSIFTKLSNLEVGVYRFELAVTDSLGMFEKDTVKVTVNRMATNTSELILENRFWIFPWYNSIEIKNFYDLIPPEAVFKIYIRRDTSTAWVEVFPTTENIPDSKYDYFIETRWPDGAGMYTNGSLYIFYYGSDVSDRPDVKIVF
jgi:hypothetical protein